MQFPKGSIIKRPLEGPVLGKVGYHMGIYCNDNQIIHFCGVTGTDSKAIVRWESLHEFAGTPEGSTPPKSIKLHQTPETERHAEQVVKRALTEFYENNSKWNGTYHLITRNCEHFCLHCFEVPYVRPTTVIPKARLAQRTKAFLFLVGFPVLVALMVLSAKRRNNG